LLLALVVPPPFAPNVVFGDVVTQPVSSAPQYADMFRSQTHFLVEFSIHGLHRAFAVLDAALRELPRVFPDPLAPKDFVLGVDEKHAGVVAVAFAIQHRATPRIQYSSPRLYVPDGPLADLLPARIQLPHQPPERSPRRRRDRQPPADDPGRHDPQVGRRDL